MWCPEFFRLAVGLGAILGVSPLAASTVTVHRLEAETVLPIEAGIKVEPSGLCLRDGRLFSVSDDTGDWIFEVVIEAERAVFQPFLHFTPPEGAGFLDLEGIAPGPADSFYLASEEQARVLQVFSDGTSQWVTDPMAEHPAVHDPGLLRRRNAGIEGIAVLDENRWLLAGERQPRGLIEVEGSEVRASTQNLTRFPRELPLLRLPDFAGLATEGEAVFGLFRNADLIVSLHADRDGNWREGAEAWSFAPVTRSDAFLYAENQFGHAEGLAVSSTHFYVVLDTNGAARTSDPSDHRPLLLIMKRPR
jgi:hypothetical protein